MSEDEIRAIVRNELNSLSEMVCWLMVIAYISAVFVAGIVVYEHMSIRVHNLESKILTHEGENK